MFEILTGVLGNGSITGDDEDNRSNTVIAIDPAIINSDFTSRASELIERLRATRLHTNHQSLRLPGEHSAAKAKKCLADNEIIIDANLYRHLVNRTDCYLKDRAVAKPHPT